MKNVCVITGGGSGIGLAAAKYISKKKIIVVSGRTMSKLEKAVAELEELGYTAYARECDISDRAQVKALAEFAAGLGNIKNVINSAGLSPVMADSETLIRVNALGTLYVNEEFSKQMKDGGVIVDVSSNSAYLFPNFLASKKTFAMAEINEGIFLRKMLRLPRLLRGYQASGLAYALSKKFVIWYAGKCAYDYSAKGIRVCSLSPGLIATDMGNLQVGEGGGLLANAAEKRMGTPEELGYALATVADERNGYLTGVDVLVDGGSVNGRKYLK